MLDATVHTADIQDRDGAPALIKGLPEGHPTLTKLFAAGGYAGEKLRTTIGDIERLAIEIVKRSDTAYGFVLLPKRWVVERTFAWFGGAAASPRILEPPLLYSRRGCLAPRYAA